MARQQWIKSVLVYFVAKINYHKIMGLKQYRFIILQLWKSKHCDNGRLASFLGTPASKGHLHFFENGSFLHLQSHQCSIFYLTSDSILTSSLSDSDAPAYGYNRQSTTWCLKYKSKNLTCLVLIDICYLQISNMCETGLFLFTAQTTG